LLKADAQRRFGGPAVHRNTDYYACLAAQIVYDHQCASEHEERVRHVRVRGGASGRMRKPLDVSNDVVSEKSHRATPELAELRHAHRLIAAENLVQISERITWLTRAVPATLGRPVLDHASA